MYTSSMWSDLFVHCLRISTRERFSQVQPSEHLYGLDSVSAPVVDCRAA